jgi:cell wall-associated NlpC family hydrolase
MSASFRAGKRWPIDRAGARRSGLRRAAVLIAGLGLGGCATVPDGTPPISRDPVTAAAQHQVGRPYRYGGEDPEGFDCSGLVYYAHRTGGGVEVPRTAREQYQRSRPVPRASLEAGDLLFFTPGADKALHVGIYVQNDYFVHAPSPGKRVSYAQLTTPFWRQSLVGAGRIR